MFSTEITRARYCLPGETTWEDVTNRVMSVWNCVPVRKSVKTAFQHFMLQKKFIPGGRILRNAGLPRHQVSNCFLFHAEDSREGWGDLTQKATVTLMTGGGIGVEYSQIRPSGQLLKSTIGIASGPLPLMRTINEIGRGVQCGGFRRSAMYASLHWTHPDIFDFIHMKDWPDWLQEQKAKNMDVAAPGDMTNISVRLDQEFFLAYSMPQHPFYSHAKHVYRETVESMLKTGEPGFQIDIDNQILRNACTEIISADDSDSCVLGALNFAKLSENELEECTNVATAFLLAVTEYNQSPTVKCEQVQKRNRRLGLEIMGIGEWFLQRGLPYGHNKILPWLQTYKYASTYASLYYAANWGFPFPVAVRAIGPTGTISIVAETTSGIEPLVAAAYDRRYLTPGGFATETLVDPVAERLYREGVVDFETAYTIPAETRIAFQTQVQSFVDNGISSTINLPDSQTNSREFGTMLYPYLSKLRGMTVFPNGSRGLQPITPIPFKDGLARMTRYEMADTSCPSGVCAL